MTLKKTFIILIIFSSINSFAQGFKGKVINASNKPILWANVILKSLPDSLYLSGTTTDENGNFTLYKPTANTNKTFIQISCIGYDNLYLEPKEDMRIITLHEKQNTLGEIVIKGKRPSFKMHQGIVTADIQHTLLANIGNSIQLLAHLPFISETNNTLSVFGRGTPIIYIDNRRIENNDELLRLSSSEIKRVELLLNPGASYGAEVKSVIKVSTIRKQEGLSIDMSSRLSLKHNLSEELYAKLNYRYKYWDFFGALGLGENKTRSQLTNTINFQGVTDNHIQQSLVYSSKSKYYNGNIGSNFSDGNNYDFGIKYNFSKTPSFNTNTYGNVNYIENAILKPSSELNLLNTSNKETHHLNTYYIRKFSENSDLQLNLDFFQGNSNSYNRTKRTNETDVTYNNGFDYNLYVAKLELSNILLGGNINYGAEVSYTDNKQDYKVLEGNIPTSISSNEDRSKQLLYSLFVAQSMSLKDYSINLGARFESANYKYYNMGKLQDKQSRFYNHFFPFCEISYNRNNEISLSLSYANSLIRPSYNQLSEGITYIDSYTYQGGNSKLTTSSDNKLSFLISWKDLLVDISHIWHKDPIIPISKKMNDNSAVLFTVENLPDYREWEMNISYNPTLGIWKPKFETGVYKQDFRYNNKKYNRPYFTYEWDNLIRICKEINLSFDLWGTSNGHSYLNYFKPTFRCDIGIHSLFFKKRLSISMKITDLLKTDKEWWNREVNGVFINKKSRRDTYGWMIQLHYSFNSPKTNYKGKTENSEINRL